jgi:HD-like signal output (HDOD) protein
MNPEVVDVIKRTAAVSSMPQVVTRFLDLMHDPDFSYDELVAVLSSDPGTAADILRLANSALFGVSRRITSLRPALTLLGPRRVRALVLGRYLVESVGNGLGGLDAAYYWRRSLACGVVAARFAEVLTPRMREEAFVAGLLSDVGVAIMAQALPGPYAPIVQLYRPAGPADITEAERRVLGTTHPEITAILLQHWHLPDVVCQAVAWHHDDVEPAGVPEQLARVVGASDAVARLLCESPQLERIAEQCERAVEHIHLDLDALAVILERVEIDMGDLAGLLRLGIIPNSSYTMILQALRQAASV